jgi:hypothetical protein
MKSIGVIFLFFVATICSAQVSVEVNEDGKYKVMRSGEWRDSGVKAEETAADYVDYFPEAINNPGSLILVEEGKKFLRFKPFFKKVEEFRRMDIIYDDSEGIIDLVEIKKERESESYLILLSLMALILIIVSNILFIKSYNIISALAIFVSAVSFLSFFYFLNSLIRGIVFFSLPIALIFIAHIISAFNKDREKYVPHTVLCYLAIILVSFCLFF